MLSKVGACLHAEVSERWWPLQTASWLEFEVYTHEMGAGTEESKRRKEMEPCEQSTPLEAGSLLSARSVLRAASLLNFFHSLVPGVFRCIQSGWDLMRPAEWKGGERGRS